MLLLGGVAQDRQTTAERNLDPRDQSLGPNSKAPDNTFTFNGNGIMNNPGKMFRSALRRSTIQTRSWQQPARKISTAPPNAPNASRPSSRWTRRLVYAGIFGTLGYCVGGWVDSKVSSPPFLPGSLEDQYFSLDLQRAFDAIPIVRELRSNPDYEEKNVYDNFADEHKSRRLTSGPLAGSRGLGFQVSLLLFWRLWHVRSTCTTAGLSSVPNLGTHPC